MVRNRQLVQMIVVGVIAVAILIPIALIIPWFPSKASTQAGNVRTLYDVLLIVSIPIFVLVETVILFSVWKFRMRPGEEEKDGPPIHGNTRLEVIWTALPAILIIGAVHIRLRGPALERGQQEGRDDDQRHRPAVRVRVLLSAGERQDGRLARSCTCAKGQPVVFKLRSLDVIHSFFVPNFSEKIDAVPGITTTLRVTPTAHRHLPGRVHRAVRGRPFADARDRPRRHAGRVPGLAGVAARNAPRRSARRRRRRAAGHPGRGAARQSPSQVLARRQPPPTRRGRQGGVHKRRLRRLPHARGGRRDRDDRARPRYPTAIGLQPARLEEHPWRDPPAVHRRPRSRSRTPTSRPATSPDIMPPNFAQTLSSTQIQALVNFLASVAK